MTKKGTVDKWVIARALTEIARYLELSEPNPFKVRAYERAARAIEGVEGDLRELVRDGRLFAVPGIGKGIGPVISELVTTGSSGLLDELRGRYPDGIFDLLRVPGLGLKKIGLLHQELGIGDLDALEEGVRNGSVAKLKGFGAKTAQKILDGIATARRRHSLLLLPIGIEIGEALREQLAASDGIDDVEVTGTVRRRLEVFSNVEIAIAARDPEAIVALLSQRGVVDAIEVVSASTVGGSGSPAATLRGRGRDDVEIVLHIAHPDDFGAAVLSSTGSPEFLASFSKKIAGEGFELQDSRLFRRGRPVAARTESELFERVGIPWIDPELREDGAELGRKKRTRLVEAGDLRGTFHIHTTFSDGRNTVLEMLTAAREVGYEYAGLSDHSQNAFYARGLTEADLQQQKKEVDSHRDAVAPLQVFRGTEADILNDGAIDYGPAILRQFDFVVASIHSRFGMEKDEMTERLLRALDDPFVTFLGHLTGRLLLSRDGYTFDFDRIFDRAAERGVMIEINGSPRRLDLDWRHIRRAVDRGVMLSIHPDAHSIREMGNVITGAWVARKGGLPAAQIFNTKPVDEVAEFLAARRKKAVAAK